MVETSLWKDKLEYRQMVELVNSIILIWKPNGTITFINPFGLQFFGYELNEIIGKSVDILVPKTESTGRVLDDLVSKILLHPEQFVNNENENIRKDGTRAWVSWTNRVILDSSGQPKEVLAVGNDITEFKKAEKEIKENSLRYINLVETIPDAIVVHSNGIIRFVNPAALTLFRANNEEEIVGNTIFSIISEDMHNIARERIKQAAVEQTPLLEYELIRLDGTRFYGEITGKNIIYKGETATQIVIRDITERKRVEEKIIDKEARFSSVLNNSPYVIYRLNLQKNRYEYISPAIKKLGLLPEEFIKMSSEEVLSRVHPEDRSDLNSALSEINENGQGSCEYRFQGNDGKYLWWSNQMVIIKDEHGNPLYRDGFVQDITDYKKARKSLQEERDLLQDIMDGAKNSHLVYLDRDFNFVRVNETYARTCGYKPQEMIGKNHFKLYPNEENESIFKYVWDTGKAVSIHDKPFEFPDQPERGVTYWDWTLTPIKNNNNVSGLIFSLYETTVRKKAELRIKKLLEYEQKLIEELQKSNDELNSITDEFKTANKELKDTQKELLETINKLEISNRELEQFAYIASHDLQEPLRMVSSFTQLLEMKYKDQLDDEALEYIKFAVDGAKRMQALINALLTFSRVSSNKIDYEEIDLNEVLKEALFNLEIKIEENNAVIKSIKLPTIKGDFNQIVQVFQNLIGNAIKYRSPENPVIDITAHRKNESYWQIDITDNGIGIEPQYHDQIFQIFRRLHTREEYPGTGIGLALCKKIINQHHGKIWAESVSREGSKFSFIIPA